MSLRASILLTVALLDFVGPLHSTTLARGSPPENLVVGDDFGILTDSDFAYQDRIGGRVWPRFQKGSLYWKCFDLKDVQFRCIPVEPERIGWNDNFDYDIRVSGTERHGYGFAHAMPLSQCHADRLEFQRLSRGQRHVCLAGSYLGVIDGVHAWVWEATRTKLGKKCHACR